MTVFGTNKGGRKRLNPSPPIAKAKSCATSSMDLHDDMSPSGCSFLRTAYLMTS